MMKVLFPIIFVLALELIPVVKTYADIRNKYGDNLSHLIPYTQGTGTSLTSTLADKFSELEKSLGSAKDSTPNYWF